MSMYVPTVYEKSSTGERYFDLYSRLLKDRIVFIQSFINEFTANVVVGQLLFLEADDPEKDIYLYINTPGGSVTDGLAIYDTIQYVRSDVQTICIGEASSIGALILASGTKGKRFSLPHSRIMIHQPLGGATGQATDIEIQANELMRVRSIINKILIRHTGKPLKTIEKDTDRDFFMSAEESKDYGIIDVVIERSENGDASGS